jgi:hypothetical protein
MATETVNIQVDPISAAILRALQQRAVSQGTSLDTILQTLAASTIGLQSVLMTPEQKADDFAQWVNSHAVSGVVADDSRESIYTREDEAL